MTPRPDLSPEDRDELQALCLDVVRAVGRWVGASTDPARVREVPTLGLDLRMKYLRWERRLERHGLTHEDWEPPTEPRMQTIPDHDP